MIKLFPGTALIFRDKVCECWLEGARRNIGENLDAHFATARDPFVSVLQRCAVFWTISEYFAR